MSTKEVIQSANAERPVASGTNSVRILRVSPESHVAKDDRVAVEAPLEYMLNHPALGLESVSFGTTMRTPGMMKALRQGCCMERVLLTQRLISLPLKAARADRT